MGAIRQPLITKLSPPRSEGIFPRKRLFDLLDQGKDVPVIWVTGPPGSGKTSLVASYLAAQNLPCLWYQVDERDADIATFFYYMGMAAKKAAPKKKKPMPLLTREYLTGVPAFTRRYFEELFSRLSTGEPSPALPSSSRKPRKSKAGQFVIVLDNYQDVPVSSGLHRIISYGLDLIPEGINIFVLSRREPPPHFARLRASNKMKFITWNELKFTLEESKKLFGIKERKLPDELLAKLHKKTDGWVAALVLIIVSSEIANIDVHSMREFPTKEIYDYFAIEILEKAENEVREFLYRTAYLPRMTAQMAEKLTGNRRTEEMLFNLSENHYFTERYSGDRPVYRYHPLFREFLTSRAETLMKPEQIASIQKNAAALMEESGQTEEAARLFQKAGNWEGVIRLILDHAESLILQGRSKPLEQWIGRVPEGLCNKNPWLLYWFGVCKQSLNPAQSHVLFERAFQGFKKKNDSAGMFLAWSGLVDAIVSEWDDFTQLDQWIGWLDDHVQSKTHFPSREIEARVASSMVQALLYRKPYHPDIRSWLDRALSSAQQLEDINLRMQAYLHAVNFYSWTGDLTQSRMAAEEIGKMARSPSASALLLVTWKWLGALMYNRSAESHDLSLQSISEGLEIAQKNGIHVWDHMLFGQGVYASFNKRDMRLANEFLKKMETTLQSRRRHGLCQYHYLTGWYHLLNDHIPLAAQSAETSEKLARETGMIFTEILCALLKGQVWYEEGEYPKARAQLAHAKKLSHKTGSRILDYMCLIREAQFYSTGEEEIREQGIKALRNAMELGRKHGYINLFPWWQPSVIADLCAKALDSGIEVDYVQDLIRKHRLAPAEPPLATANWPWPLKINTLGKFELYKDGAPLTFSRKVQKKPLLLLKALIALGGRDIKEEQITDLIWPDSEGDAAHNAFKTTLYRLRHLIGEEAILLQEGKASLNPSSCWVDTTVFELISRRADVFSRRSREEEENSGESKGLNDAMALAKMAMDIYRGHFLASDEDQTWTIPYRERLRNRCLSLVTRLGEYLKETGNLEKALEVFQRALEIDPFAEEIYQQLMICYRHLHEHVKAAAVYERCKKTLHSSGLQPSTKTEAIYRTIRDSTQA